MQGISNLGVKVWAGVRGLCWGVRVMVAKMAQFREFI